jgi:Na+-translocating ferredoxin:NAD+ oxidoreductase subunit A
MSEWLLLLVSAALVNNFVLVRFLGLCPFLGVSSRLDHALGMAAATGFVLCLSAVLSFALEHALLKPYGLDWLRTLSFILTIAVAVQFLELSLRHGQPRLHRVLGIYLPLITTNCAVLGVALLNSSQARSLLDALGYAIGAALGFALVLSMMAALRERLRLSPVPSAWAGAPIALLSAGLMALGFLGFSGMDR